MKTRVRQSMLVAAASTALAMAGITGAGIASAATGTSGQSSLIDKLATKFNLNKDEVAAVFSADRKEHEAQMQADRAKQLAAAVTAGKLTQAQADYITAAQKEIDTLRDSAEPGQETDAQRTAMKTKMDALQTWAKTNNVDAQYLGGPGGPGGPGGTPPASSSGSSTT